MSGIGGNVRLGGAGFDIGGGAGRAVLLCSDSELRKCRPSNEYI